MHMLNYIAQQRTTGIKFTENQSGPVAFVDASNKDDPADGKTQYGYSIHWGGEIQCTHSDCDGTLLPGVMNSR